MTIYVSHTTVNCANAFMLSEWWKQVLGYVDVPDDPNEAGDLECMILDPGGSHRLLFIQVDDLQEPIGRMHLDLASAVGYRDDEVRRVIGLGAELVADRRRSDGGGWVVLSDPEGNHFCVVRSEMEQEPTAP